MNRKSSLTSLDSDMTPPPPLWKKKPNRSRFFLRMASLRAECYSFIYNQENMLKHKKKCLHFRLQKEKKIKKFCLIKFNNVVCLMYKCIWSIWERALDICNTWWQWNSLWNSKTSDGTSRIFFPNFHNQNMQPKKLLFFMHYLLLKKI